MSFERNTYRGGHVHVCREMCSTCIFRPGNPMYLRSGVVRGMVDAALADDAAITCHQTLGGDTAVCRGFFDRHKTTPLALAIELRRLREVEPSDTTQTRAHDDGESAA